MDILDRRAARVSALLLCAVAWARVAGGATAGTAQAFFDHFNGAALSSQWTAVAGANGVVCVNGSTITGSGTCAGSISNQSFLELNSAAATDSAFVYYGTPLDTTRSQLWKFSTRTLNNARILIVNSADRPGADTLENWNGKTRMGMFTAVVGGTFAWTFDYWDRTHTQFEWDTAGTSTWTTPKVAALTPIHTDMFYELGLEIDGPNQRWRMIGWVADNAAGSFLQGALLMALTDWVEWSGQEATDNLWLVLGNPYSDGESIDQFFEWAALDDGAPVIGWQNGENLEGSGYDVRRVEGYASVNGIMERAVPLDRSTIALAHGTGSSWDNNGVKDQMVLRDTDACYMVYSGNQSGGPQEIGIATNTTPDCLGAWTKAAGNPIVATVPNTQEAALGNPYLIKDLGEPDPDRRYKLIYGGDTTSPITHHILMRACAGPPDTCTWSPFTTLITQESSPPCDFGYVHAIPYPLNSTWYVFVSCHTNDYVFTKHVTYFSGPSLTSLNKSGVTLVAADTGCAATLTSAANGTRRVTVDSTAGCSGDQYIILNNVPQDPNAYWQNRILSVDSDTELSLYHWIDGATIGGSTPARLRGFIANARQEPLQVVTGLEPNSFYMYVDNFDYFSADVPPYADSFANQTGLVASTAGIGGPYSAVQLDDPVAYRHNFGHLRSEQALALITTPLLVVADTPTSTPSGTPATPTATGPSATPTESPAATGTPTLVTTPTATATLPTPTMTARPATAHCDGDCDDEDHVGVADLLVEMNSALLGKSADQCEADNDGDDRPVTVHDILDAVNNALSGCPVPTP